jgi:acetate kinase
VPEPLILAINTGSSSLKFGLYTNLRDTNNGGDERSVFEGSVDGNGGDAMERAVQQLRDAAQAAPVAIAHRVVHGGPHLVAHQRITPALVDELRKNIHFAPLHISVALQLIEKASALYPNVPQYACFDTVFHQTMPEVAARFALPRELFCEGVRRYGFHGLSYESIVFQLGNNLPSRLVIAHLGSGSSLAAVKNGRSVDTTMGLTPTGGIPMATRSGDLDPGVLLYLMRSKNLNADSLEDLLNRDSGLAGLSGITGDMRELEAAADAGNHEAQLAMEVFCTAIRKTVASYAAVLGGLDMLVFTGGIGEHSVQIRKTICDGLEFIGISHKSGRVRVEAMESQEDRQIARHCRRMHDFESQR